MTESEWRNEKGNAQWMLYSLRDRGFTRTKAGRRQFRLFACGCCRVVWQLLPDERLRNAVQTAERFAEGLATKEELAAAHAAVEWMTTPPGPFSEAAHEVHVAVAMAAATTESQAFDAALSITATGTPLAGQLVTAAAEVYLCQLVRCIFGNPFRAIPARPAWRSATVVDIARGITADGAFDRLPILADALEEAGCTDAEMFAHCRDGGPHVRGCWVVDWALKTR